MKYATFVSLTLSVAALAHPHRRAAPFAMQNGQDAIALNNKFKGLKEGGACSAGENACIGTKFAQCVNGKFVTQPCGAGTICAALPLVNSAGTSITCTTQADVNSRIAATGATGGSTGGSMNMQMGGGSGKKTGGAKTTPKVDATTTTDDSEPDCDEDPQDNGNSDPNNGGSDGGNSTTDGSNGGNPNTGGNGGKGGKGGKGGNKAKNGGNGGDAQSSLTLDPAVIAQGFAQNGQENATVGQVASLTSTNNFINFCLTAPGVPITNGQQIKTGSCNPAPIGLIPSTDNMPSTKFVFPQNNQVIGSNKNFTIQLAIAKLQTGNFVNAETNYFAAPQQLDNGGQVVGHSHVVVEQVDATSKTPSDASVFSFFKGLNDAAVNGILTAVVGDGLPAGSYRVSSITTAANHQPVVGPVAQHGAFEDAVYFTVKDGA